MFYVYLLKSESNNEYCVGSTNNLKRRLYEHNSGKEFATKRYLPWKLFYYEAFETEHLSRMREQKLKQHGNALRELKKRLGIRIMALPSTGQSGAGFTLVELMIVVVLIGILAAIALMFFAPQLLKGNDATRKADIDRIKIALEEYEKDHNCYPARDEMLNCGTDASIAIHPYLNNVPCDPVKHIAYYYDAPSNTSCGLWFRLYTILQNKNDTSATPNIGPSGSYNYAQSSENAPD